MAFSRGPYAYQENLPAPAETYIATSRKIDFARGVYVQDAVGNPEAMADTAQRVALTVAFEAGKPPTIINERTIAKRRKDIEAALFRLVREGAIRNVRVIVEQRGAKLDEDVLFEDALSTRPTRIRNGKLWTSVSWIATAPGSDGTLALPSWLTYECATAETSAQTGPGPARTGFAAHAARAFSRDGVSWGLLVEPSGSNLFGDQDVSGASYSSNETPTVTATTAPDGTLSAWRVEDDDPTKLEYRQRDNWGTIESGKTYTVSFWKKNLDGTGTQILTVVESGVRTFLTLNAGSAADTDWSRVDATFTATESSAAGAADMRLVPASIASAVNRAEYWATQIELRAYPTSFIGSDNATFTREAGTVKALSSTIAPHGHFDLAITFAPLYASTEIDGEHDVLFVDANNRCFYDGDDDSFHLVLHGTEVATVGPVTFSRDQALTVTARHLADGCSLTVAGATTGNGTDEAGAVARISPAKHIHILGSSGGAQEGASLQAIVSTAA